MGSVFGRKPKKSKRRFVPTPASVIAIVALFVALGGGAYAVSGKVSSRDIAKKAIKPKHFSKKAEDYIKSLVGQGAPGTPGTPGTPGAGGAPGTPGAPGASTAAEYVGPNWGIITRNHIGSAVADLRSGPFGSFGNTGADAAPPFGEGSLGIAVSENATTSTPPAEKASFGNEVDFLGDPVLDIDDVGFHVFQADENTDIGGNEASTRNLPSITFEIDPNLSSTTSGFSSLVWLPPAAPADNQWSGYMDATTGGDWMLTGAAGTATSCGQSNPPCSFSQVMTALGDTGPEGDPVIFSASVTKGRDNRWVGAVDGLRINDTIYDFEPFGVEETPAP